MGARQLYIHASSTAEHVGMPCWLRSSTLLPNIALERAATPALYSSSHSADQIPHYNISFVLQQQLYHFLVPIPDCPVQHCPSIVILQIDICVVLQQQLHHRSVPILGSPV